MKHLTGILLLLATLVVPAWAQAADFGEASVKRLISGIDRGMAAQDARQLADLFSDHAIITMHIHTRNGSRTMRISKRQYIDMLRRNWSMFDHYKHSRSNVKIALHGSKAIVTDNVTESITSRGQSMTAVSKEEVVIQRVNGRPRITRIIAYTDM